MSASLTENDQITAVLSRLAAAWNAGDGGVGDASRTELSTEGRVGGDSVGPTGHDRGVTSTTTPPASSVKPGRNGVQQRIADELGVRDNQVAAAVELLDGGATV